MSIVAPRKTNAPVIAAPKKKVMTGRSLPASPLTFQAAMLLDDLEGGEGGQMQDDGSPEKNGMVVCLYGDKAAAVLGFLLILP
jgi:hypothetical protein